MRGRKRLRSLGLKRHATPSETNPLATTRLLEGATKGDLPTQTVSVAEPRARPRSVAYRTSRTRALVVLELIGGTIRSSSSQGNVLPGAGSDRSDARAHRTGHNRRGRIRDILRQPSLETPRRCAPPSPRQSGRSAREWIRSECGDPYGRAVPIAAGMGRCFEGGRGRWRAIPTPSRSLFQRRGRGTVRASGCTSELEARSRDSYRRSLKRQAPSNLRHTRSCNPTSLPAPCCRCRLGATTIVIRMWCPRRLCSPALTITIRIANG
jgi:hypothetical protein